MNEEGQVACCLLVITGMCPPGQGLKPSTILSDDCLQGGWMAYLYNLVLGCQSRQSLDWTVVMAVIEIRKEQGDSKGFWGFQGPFLGFPQGVVWLLTFHRSTTRDWLHESPSLATVCFVLVVAWGTREFSPQLHPSCIMHLGPPHQLDAQRLQIVGANKCAVMTASESTVRFTEPHRTWPCLTLRTTCEVWLNSIIL